MLKNSTVRELSKRLGKSSGYLSEMAKVVQLLNKLDRHGVKVEYYPADLDRERGKALPYYHAIKRLFR